MHQTPQTYALTTVTHQSRRLFQRTANAELLLETILSYRDANRFLLHGFVIMPDHLHLLLTPTESIEKKLPNSSREGSRLPCASNLRARYGMKGTSLIE